MNFSVDQPESGRGEVEPVLILQLARKVETELAIRIGVELEDRDRVFPLKRHESTTFRDRVRRETSVFLRLAFEDLHLLLDVVQRELLLAVLDRRNSTVIAYCQGGIVEVDWKGPDLLVRVRVVDSDSFLYRWLVDEDTVGSQARMHVELVEKLHFLSVKRIEQNLVVAVDHDRFRTALDAIDAFADVVLEQHLFMKTVIEKNYS